MHDGREVDPAGADDRSGHRRRLPVVGPRRRGAGDAAAGSTGRRRTTWPCPLTTLRRRRLVLVRPRRRVRRRSSSTRPSGALAARRGPPTRRRTTPPRHGDDRHHDVQPAGLLHHLLRQLGDAPDARRRPRRGPRRRPGHPPRRRRPGLRRGAAASATGCASSAQANLGGSGGFSRAMIETLDAGRSRPRAAPRRRRRRRARGHRAAAAFAGTRTRPTVVGGHMFSMHARSVLHAFAEVVRPWQFRWAPAAPVEARPRLRPLDLRSTPWLHRRIHVDYNGWWMCLIPRPCCATSGCRCRSSSSGTTRSSACAPARPATRPSRCPARRSGTCRGPTRTTALDWQAYFHARNRLVAALLHSRVRPRRPAGPREPGDHGQAPARDAVLRGRPAPAGRRGRARRARPTCTRHSRPGSARCAPCGPATPTPRPRPDVDDFAAVRSPRPRRTEPGTARPASRLATLRAAASGIVAPVAPRARRTDRSARARGGRRRTPGGGPCPASTPPSSRPPTAPGWPGCAATGRWPGGRSRMPSAPTGELLRRVARAGRRLPRGRCPTWSPSEAWRRTLGLGGAGPAEAATAGDRIRRRRRSSSRAPAAGCARCSTVATCSRCSCARSCGSATGPRCSGSFWSYVKPAVQFVVYFVGLGLVLRQNAIGDYAVYLFGGLVVVTALFGEAFGNATRSIVRNGALVSKIYLPRELFPVASVCVAAVHLLPQLVVLFVGALVAGWRPDVVAVFSPSSPAWRSWRCSRSGSGCCSSALNVLFRDVENVVDLVLTRARLDQPGALPLVAGRRPRRHRLLARSALPAQPADGRGRAGPPRLLGHGARRATSAPGRRPTARRADRRRLRRRRCVLVAVGQLVFRRLSGRFAQEL